MENNQIRLSEQDKFTLEPFLEQFDGLKVNDYSAIQRILNLVEPRSHGISYWKKAMIKVIEQGNEARFRELLGDAS